MIQLLVGHLRVFGKNRGIIRAKLCLPVDQGHRRLVVQLFPGIIILCQKGRGGFLQNGRLPVKGCLNKILLHQSQLLPIPILAGIIPMNGQGSAFQGNLVVQEDLGGLTGLVNPAAKVLPALLGQIKKHAGKDKGKGCLVLRIILGADVLGKGQDIAIQVFFIETDLFLGPPADLIEIQSRVAEIKIHRQDLGKVSHNPGKVLIPGSFSVGYSHVDGEFGDISPLGNCLSVGSKQVDGGKNFLFFQGLLPFLPRDRGNGLLQESKSGDIFCPLLPFLQKGACLKVSQSFLPKSPVRLPVEGSFSLLAL